MFFAKTASAELVRLDAYSDKSRYLRLDQVADIKCSIPTESIPHLLKCSFVSKGQLPWLRIAKLAVHSV